MATAALLTAGTLLATLARAATATLLGSGALRGRALGSRGGSILGTAVPGAATLGTAAVTRPAARYAHLALGNLVCHGRHLGLLRRAAMAAAAARRRGTGILATLLAGGSALPRLARRGGAEGVIAFLA